MSDPTPPEPHDPDERLGAWLDGELTESRARAVAAEIEADAELAARLEALREVRERLAGSWTAEVPEGFTARVRQAVAAETGAPPPAGEEPAHEGDPPAAASFADARARRTRRRRLVAVGSVAAALVAVAVVAPLASDLPPTSDDAGVSDLAQETGDADDAAEAPPEGARDSADTSAGTGEEARRLEAQDAEPAEEDSDAASGGDLPLVVDQQREFASRGALLAHASDRPEATRLLGTGPGRAAELADRTAATLRRAEPFVDGTDPAACLPPVTEAVDGPAVIARVERLAVDGRAFTAHLVVSGRPGDPLERITLYVADPRGDCAIHLTERLDD